MKQLDELLHDEAAVIQRLAYRHEHGQNELPGLDEVANGKDAVRQQTETTPAEPVCNLIPAGRLGQAPD